MSGFFIVLTIMIVFLVAATITIGIYLYSLYVDRKLNTSWNYSFGLLLIILLILGWKTFIDFAIRL